MTKTVSVTKFEKQVKIRRETFFQKIFKWPILFDILIQVGYSIGLGDRWVFRWILKGRCKKIEIIHEYASNKRYDHFQNF